MSGPVAASKKIADDLQQIEDDHKVGITQVVKVQGRDEPVAPAKYYEKDSRDDYYEAKRAVTQQVTSQGGLGGIGTQVLVTDEDIKYLRDQRTKEELYTYDKWFYETFLFGGDPNKIALAKEFNPDWFSRREDNIRNVIRITKNLAKMGLRGPQNEDEIKLLYAIQTGRVEIPNVDYLFPELAKQQMTAVMAAEKRGSITQGYFNPKSFTNQKTVNTNPFSQNTPWRVTPTHTQAGTTARGPLYARNATAYNNQIGRLG